MFSIVKLLKSPGTKLVVIKIDVSDECLITSIRLEGDYFASNPQPIDDLMRTKLSIDQLRVAKTVSEALKKADVYGMPIPEVLSALKVALKEVQEICARK